MIPPGFLHGQKAGDLPDVARLFEQAITAPSMKAALEAWGADSNLFHQVAAKESTDPDVIAATMKKPSVPPSSELTPSEIFPLAS